MDDKFILPAVGYPCMRGIMLQHKRNAKKFYKGQLFRNCNPIYLEIIFSSEQHDFYPSVLE